MAKLGATAPKTEVGIVPIHLTPEETNGITPVAGEKKFSPKNKKSLGIPDDHKISWVPMDAPAEYSAMLHAVAAVRGVSILKFLSDELKKTLGAQHDALVAEAARYIKPEGKGSKAKSIDDMNDAEIEAAVDKATKAQQAAEEKARQLIAAAKARKAVASQG